MFKISSFGLELWEKKHLTKTYRGLKLISWRVNSSTGLCVQVTAVSRHGDTITDVTEATSASLTDVICTVTAAGE